MPVPLLTKSPAGDRWLEGARWRELRQPLLKGKQTAFIHNLTYSKLWLSEKRVGPFSLSQISCSGCISRHREQLEEVINCELTQFV